MKVTITEGYAVYVEAEGKQVSGPAEVDVPDDQGAHWISRGWASKVEAPKVEFKVPGSAPKVSTAPPAKKAVPRR